MTNQRDLPPGLSESRAEIDRIDAEILRLLTIRLAEVMRASQIKHAAGMPYRDEEREAEIIQNAADRGEDFGLPKKQIKKIFKQILRISAELRADGD